MNVVSPAAPPRHQRYEGRTLGGFRLIREIASGGMATVYLGYKAQQAGVRQLAAVKVIHPHLAGQQDFVDMFLDEARIASHINHPNVCRVLDFGNSEGTYYLAMEYVVGETWAEVIKRMSASPKAGPMIVPVLAQVLAQACEGLHAAHVAQDSYGNPLRIVHRDVSPYNLMVGYDGSVRVLDFGIASAVDRIHTTRTGAVKGRLAYMAPEQMRGMPVDARADIWSLGVVLWEGLARRRLFPGSSDARTVFAVTQEPIPSPSGSGHPIPATLLEVVTKALQRDASLRYASARALGRDLSRFHSEWTKPAGMSEVSEWMHRLFESEFDCKRALVREGADGANGKLPGLDAENSGHAAASGIRECVVPQADGTTDGASFVSGALRSATPVRARHPGLRVAAVACLALALFAGVQASGAAERQQHQSRPNAPTQPGSLGVIGAPVTAQTAPDPSRELDLIVSLSDVESAQDATPPKMFGRSNKLGQVSIATSGAWAVVYIGARKVGTTPVRLSLPEGIHTLRLRRFGTGPDIVRRVSVTSGAASRLKISMDDPGASP